MHYEIRRGYIGKPLSLNQRRSGLFAEEPTVLGRVLRRGTKPLVLTPEQFELHQIRLRLLQKAGAIEIVQVGAPPKPEEPKPSEQATKPTEPTESMKPVETKPEDPSAETGGADPQPPPATEAKSDPVPDAPQ